MLWKNKSFGGIAGDDQAPTLNNVKCLGEISDEENEDEESFSAVDGGRGNIIIKGLDFVSVLMSPFFTKI